MKKSDIDSIGGKLGSELGGLREALTNAAQPGKTDVMSGLNALGPDVLKHLDTIRPQNYYLTASIDKKGSTVTGMVSGKDVSEAVANIRNEANGATGSMTVRMDRLLDNLNTLQNYFGGKKFHEAKGDLESVRPDLDFMHGVFEAEREKTVQARTRYTQYAAAASTAVDVSGAGLGVMGSVPAHEGMKQPSKTQSPNKFLS